ncbi:MAG TPA: TIGR03862 family flavoprotein, partial [Nevskiaceae bacterium]|nr:TIGR03862 family flavoprotein [Nevskiaceae bacterium]
ASWPQLGSDGAWVEPLATLGAEVARLRPSNCGFDVAWSGHFASRHAGQPVKPVALTLTDVHGRTHTRQGEFVVTASGVEGSLVYALSAELRELIDARGSAHVEIDLAPGRDASELLQRLARDRGSRSLGEHLRRAAGIDGVRAGLLFEHLLPEERQDPARLAARIKSIPLHLLHARPVQEAISTAGGVRLDALDEHLMLRARPGVFCAGEMLDWEAPTGGYLLTACFASGRLAGHAAATWMHRAAHEVVAP